MTNEAIAAAIKWHRENLEYKSKEVAAHLNISESSYSKLENGDRTITAEELCKIAKLFMINLDDLIKIPSRRKHKN
ncbi:helix-turn-helix domain-containing protein [Macrococcoides caseolyticum]|uniref:helix-turn-helix domain-containing protein n=1 Tax=Macrococcoides caseolyticum TaxID=69966 RepID=UPI001F47BF5A|nr:helix-turn-helix transcriptional regulator [Macrococcus caseolyticus]MCE4957998.1 helix-turn-helix transcriptional regulator [Macrococcus caseolyticus]